jgi:protein TonB
LQGIENGFAALIREKIASAKTYPASSRQAGHEGKVLVAFVLSKDGHVLDASIQRTSSHEKLDDAALEAVKKASPFPPIPEKLRRESMSFKLPISFNLK